MALRTGHGKGAGTPRIEVLPADEQPEGVAGPARPAPTRDAAGRFVKSSGTTAAARRGGLASAEKRQLGQLLGLKTPSPEAPLAPYYQLAREFRDAELSQLASGVGGGVVGAAAASMVSTAALQLAASRWLTDLGIEHSNVGALEKGSRFADASRQSLLAAHELTARRANLAPPGATVIDFAATARQLKGGNSGT